ncbi:MAG: hypothetical protein ABI664_12205 [bacterium]
MPKSYSIFAAVLVVASLAAPMDRAAAQMLAVPHVSLMGGVSQFDLAGTGRAPFGAIRLDVPLVFVIAEASVGVFRPKEDFGTSTYIIPEVQIQYQFVPYLVKPYAGIGGGVVRAISGPGTHTSEFTGSASGGVRVAVPVIGATFRAEVRARGIGSSFDGSAVEYTLGLSF